MASITTAEQVVELTGGTFSDAQQTRMTSVLIPRAERYVKRETGGVFYDADDDEADASQDWLLVVSLIVERMLAAENPTTKAAELGPYASEKLGDYSYTLKDRASLRATIAGDLQIAEILARYTTVPAAAGLVVNGPTRAGTTQLVDCEVDISRASIWGTLT